MILLKSHKKCVIPTYFFPMANIYLSWPDFAHGPAVFPWEKPVSHGKRGFCHGKVNFKCCLKAFIIRIGNQ